MATQLSQAGAEICEQAGAHAFVLIRAINTSINMPKSIGGLSSLPRLVPTYVSNNLPTSPPTIQTCCCTSLSYNKPWRVQELAMYALPELLTPGNHDILLERCQTLSFKSTNTTYECFLLCLAVLMAYV
jgi:hypothetical protein